MSRPISWSSFAVPLSRLAPALVAVALLISLGAGGARADVALVPRQYTTLQQAVDAVAGTANALVLIDSDGVFDESLEISHSVAIAGGEGYRPVLRGRPASRGPAGAIVSFEPGGRSHATLSLRRLRLEPAPGARALRASGQGAVHLRDLELAFAEPTSRGFEIDGDLAFSVRDSLFEVSPGQAAPSVLGHLSGSTRATVRGNQFVLAEGSRALWTHAPGATLRLDSARCAAPLPTRDSQTSVKPGREGTRRSGSAPPTSTPAPTTGIWFAEASAPCRLTVIAGSTILRRDSAVEVARVP